MDSTRFKYRSTFTSVARVIVPTDEDRFIAKASLSNLGGLMPAGVNPDENPDMLYIAFDGAVAGLVNKNADAITAKTALAINGTAQYKFISMDHDRDRVVGVVIHPAFSRFGTNEILTTEQASALQEPFNMSYVGALWKTVAPMLSKFLRKIGDSTDSDSLATSWEIAFDRYSIGVGAKNLFDAKIVPPDDSSYAAYDGMLRANGGSGKDIAGNEVYRVIDGDAVILGYSIVANPAAAVKGILPLEKPEAPVSDSTASQPPSVMEKIVEKLSGADESLKISARDLAAALTRVGTDSQSVEESFSALLAVASEENDKKNITNSNNSSVTLSTRTMKIESVEQISSQWTELCKLDANVAVAAVTDFVKAIEDGAKVYVEKVNTANTLADQFKASQAAAEAKTKELEQSLAQIQNELSEVRASAEAAAAAQKFTERMASFDEKFELEDEDRALIAEDVRAIASDNDAAFETYAKKMDRLLAAKKKGAKPFPPKKDEKKDGEKKGDKPDDKEPDDDDDDMEDMKAAVASITEIPGQTTIPKMNDVVIDTSLKARMDSAFGGALKVNGKTPAELAAAAAARDAAK